MLEIELQRLLENHHIDPMTQLVAQQRVGERQALDASASRHHDTLERDELKHEAQVVTPVEAATTASTIFAPIRATSAGRAPPRS